MEQELKIVRRFRHEHQLLKLGVARIAGVDEAGRGPLAGPVVAAAVVLPESWVRCGMPRALRALNDSKQLTAKAREDFFNRLTGSGEVHFGIARVEVELIDQINILQATHRAMNEALAQLNPTAEHALVDGLRVKTLRWAHTAIVEGDGLSYSIAAASILAKVTRDRIMVQCHQQFPQYGFDGHKGYGTPSHLAALRQHGPCPQHRRSFAPIREVQQELFY